MALTVDEILQQGRYRVRKHLGQGGMGTVYLAEDQNLSRQLVAIKENTDTSHTAQEQFQQEAMILARLSHPNLPRVTDHFIEASGRQYLVMDYIQGEDLREIGLKQGGPLPEAQVLAWMDQVMDALEYMHNWDDAETGEPNSIVHRDIKPGNIKRTPNGRIVLVDFGLAKYQTDLGTHIGARGISLGYSPLEQHTGGTDVRSDIYALGATLYTLLTGVRPPDSLVRAAGTPLQPPRKLNPSLTRKTERVIQRAMQLQATERFQSVADMREALTGSTPRRGTPPPLGQKRNQKNGQAPLFVAETKRRPAHPLLSPVSLGIGLCLLLFIIASALGMPFGQWWSGDNNLVEKWVTTLSQFGPASSPSNSEEPNTPTNTPVMAAVAISTTTPALIVSATLTTPITRLAVPPTDTSVATVTLSVTNTVTATPQPTATNTHTATPTDEPTATATAPPTLQPTATATPLPTATPTPDLAATAAVIQAAVNATLTAIATAIPPTATNTHTTTPTDEPTATATASATVTAPPTLQPTATATATPLPTATPTPDLAATAAVLQAAVKATLTAIAAAVPPTATSTATPSPTDEPTVTLTSTAPPTPPATATATATLTPDLTATQEVMRAAVNATLTALVTLTPTRTPTAIPTLSPTYTATPAATPSSTPTPTRRATATATNTPTPKVTPTWTPKPTATATATPLPTKTRTATPTSTATNTATPIPTPTRTATPTSIATNTATPIPAPSPTPAPTSTPVPVNGSVTLIGPLDAVLNGSYTFRWTTNIALGPNQFYEMVFWPAGQDPMVSGFGPAGSSTATEVTIDLNKASDILPKYLAPGRDYEWGVLLVELNPYHKLQYLGGGHRFRFERSGSSGSTGGNDNGGNDNPGNDNPTPTPRG